jgi:CO dehydrogenase nickel-insertion accessory protein CooC1
MAKQTSASAPTKAVHFILQGKGGVGKSFVSAVLAQYFRSIGVAAKCVDTVGADRNLTHL